MTNIFLRTTTKRDILTSVLIGLVLTALSYGVGIGFGWVTSLNWLEVSAVFTSYMSTYLCVVERRFNYPMGSLSSALYAILFFQAGLYSSTVLNLYLVPALAYGWWRWKRDADTRPVTKLDKKWIPAYAAVAIGAYLLVRFILSFVPGGQLLWTDTVILVLTVVAQALLDNKKLLNWPVWAVMNCFAIYTYATAGLALVVFQYVLFLANTLYGWYVWRKSMQDHKELHFKLTDDLIASLPRKPKFEPGEDVTVRFIDEAPKATILHTIALSDAPESVSTVVCTGDSCPACGLLDTVPLTPAQPAATVEP